METLSDKLVREHTRESLESFVADDSGESVIGVECGHGGDECVVSSECERFGMIKTQSVIVVITVNREKRKK